MKSNIYNTVSRAVRNYSKTYTAPRPEHNSAYVEALKCIEGWKSAIPITNELAQKSLNMEQHFAYKALTQKNAVISNGNDISRYFLYEEYKRRDLPFLMCDALNMGVVGDLFPAEITPKLVTELCFENPQGRNLLRKVFRGELVSPTDCMRSPRVSLIANKFEPSVQGKLAFMLVDLDYPCTDTGSLEDFCHWLVVNVPFNEFIDIPSAGSPYLGPSESSGCGDVIFPYAPPHPSKANPKFAHRYVFVVLDQGDKTVDPTQFGDISAEKLDLEPRFLKQKAWRLAKDLSSMTPSNSICGYAFFRAGHDDETSEIFTSLGIHEPVFARPPKDAAKFYASLEPQGPISFGKKPELKTTLDFAIRKTIESAKAPLSAHIKPDKQSIPKRKSVVDTVKVVKSKSGDIASKTKSKAELAYIKKFKSYKYQFN